MSSVEERASAEARAEEQHESLDAGEKRGDGAVGPAGASGTAEPKSAWKRLSFARLTSWLKDQFRARGSRANPASHSAGSHEGRPIVAWPKAYGYGAMVLWLVLLFGGIWFPATSILKHMFDDASPPTGVVLGNSIHSVTRDDDSAGGDAGRRPQSANSSSEDKEVLDSSGESGAKPQGTSEIDGDPAPGRALTFWQGVLLLPFCLIFWSWTNIALLCVMASMMGEINRCASINSASQSVVQRPDIESALTRSFFVYLFVLVSEITLAGSLTAIEGKDMQEAYTRIAILASVFCFVASYQPAFYSGLIDQISRGLHTADQVTEGDTAQGSAGGKDVNPPDSYDQGDATQNEEFCVDSDGDHKVGVDNFQTTPKKPH